MAVDSKSESDELRKQYEEYSRQCREAPSGSSDTTVIADLPAYRKIMELGVRVIPILAEDCPRDPVLAEIGLRLCSLEPGRSEDKVQRFRKYLEDRAELPKAFATLYEKWKEALRQGASNVQLENVTRSIDLKSGKIKTEVTYTPAGNLYQEMKRLGIFVVPLLMDKIARDDTSLIPLLVDLTHNEVDLSNAGSSEETKRSVLSWWQNRKAHWTLSPAHD